MWTMVCALGLWIVGLGLAFLAGALAAGWRRQPIKKGAPEPQEDPLTAEKKRRQKQEIDNFMKYDGTPQDQL